MKPIVIASDHAGFLLKEKLKLYLKTRGFKFEDLGAYCRQRADYPRFAYKLAKTVAGSKSGRGILICKSGIGNSIVANRLPGVRAALCYNAKAARLSRAHNDSNVLVLGAAFVSAEEAKRITGVWLNSGFLGGRHRKRLKLIEDIEKELCGNRRKG